MREIQSLARGIQMLDMIINSGQGQSVTELAEAMQIDKSSVSRLLKTLAGYGYLQQDSETRHYTIGKRLVSVSWQLVNRYAVRETAKPYLHRLAAETGECSHIAVYSAGKALVTDDVEPTTSLLRVVGNAGRLLYLHCTAVGKALIAFGDFPLPTDLRIFTPRTIIDPDQLHDHLADVRQQGYAFDDEEHEPGVRCLAAPVYDNVGVVIASMGLSGPALRLTDDKLDYLAHRVIVATRELSTEFGYTPQAYLDLAME